MSHNVHYKNIVVTDMDILAKAVEELSAEASVPMTLEMTSAQVRGYGGSKHAADAAILLPTQRYDIGFKRDEENKYTPFFESGFMARGLAANGSKATSLEIGKAESAYNHPLGLLMQRYALITVERNARTKMLPTRRVFDQATQQVQLVLG